jgi:periodic tryptophan protein 2
MVFDPFDLDIDVTPDNVKRTLKNREFAKALSLAFRLNERPLVKYGVI